MLAERIEAQTKMIADIACEVRKTTQFMTDSIVDRSRLTQANNAAHARIDELKIRVDNMEKVIDGISLSIDRLVSSNKVMIWMASGIGVLILALLFKIFTGEVVLVTP